MNDDLSTEEYTNNSSDEKECEEAINWRWQESDIRQTIKKFQSTHPYSQHVVRVTMSSAIAEWKDFNWYWK